MTLLGAQDGDHRSYVEIAEILRAAGSAPRRDMAELWRRMVCNIMISNVDDHLRNHGFLRDPAVRGWKLSPAYDLETSPSSHKSPVHHTFITLDNGMSSLDLAFSVAREFGLAGRDAKNIAAEVAAAVRQWSEVARKAGSSEKDMEMLRDAFRWL
jgi:serine/threonine-protein kinase HipA